MTGQLILTAVFGGLIILWFVLYFVFCFASFSYEEKCPDSSGFDSWNEFHTAYDKWEDKKPLVARIYDYDYFSAIMGVILSIIILFFVIFGIIALCGYISASSSIIQWQETYNMIKAVEEAGTDIENIALSQTKIQFNTWLTEARASLEYWGNWSRYYWVADELQTLQYLT